MLAMVLGLFTVGTARADGAWVLWNCIEFERNGNQKWDIGESFTTAEECKSYLNQWCSNMRKNPYPGSQWLNPCMYRINMEGSGWIRSSFICLPESVDPRK